MDILFKIILIIHILAGSIGLISGTINIIRKKGDKPHKNVGKFFLYGMIIAGFASLLLSILHPNYFLFIVGIFTIYMTGTGERYLFLKQLLKGQKPKIIDWILTYSMLIFGIIFIGFGIYKLITKEMFGLVFLVFGYLGLRMVKTDFKVYKGISKEKNYWLVIHLQRMIGSYIASLTAFLVVNNKYLPDVLVWLLPTLLLTPLIYKWTRKYRVE